MYIISGLGIVKNEVKVGVECWVVKFGLITEKLDMSKRTLVSKVG
jgi:hypothetical protein